ncbi:MAG: hypothetical protein J5I93_16890 [Pirellulaceae bacterium]|nr:hypothetical protein [Pirellulaceae bacterium]
MHDQPQPHVVDLVDDYVHDLLSEAEAERVSAHCQACAACAAALEAARQRLAAMRALPPVEAAQQLVDKTVDRVARRVHRREQVWWWWSRGTALATAATLLILGSLHAWYWNLRPTPYDLRILGQESLRAGTQAQLRVGVFDRHSGQPVAGAPVTIELLDSRNGSSLRLASIQTGDDGSEVAELNLPDWEEGNYQLRLIAAPNGTQEQLQRSIRLRRDWKLMLTTDKPVYQPGQTIHIRALALRQPDLLPIDEQPVQFEVLDPRGNVIVRRQQSSSRFGISHTDCLLGNEILEGPYQVVCRIGQTTSERTVKVEKYVLPKFKLQAQLDKPFYLPGETIQVGVSSDYFFGQPVAGGEVQVQVLDEVRQPLLAEPVRGNTDNDGRCTLAVPMPGVLAGLPQESGVARAPLLVEVTDTAGQTEVVQVTARVASEPLVLGVVPAAGTLVVGIPNEVFVQALYPDGRPAEVDVRVAGIDDELRTDSLGIAAFEITPQHDQVTLDLEARDSQGQSVRRQVLLAASRAADDFLFLTDRAVYRSGETMHLTVRGGGVEPVFVDVLRDGQTVLSRLIEVTDGRGEVAVDLPAELFGALQLVAFRFGRDGVAVRKSRLVFARRASDLQITAQLDSDTYRPGQHARLQLKLTDAAGTPVPGAISLAAVDEAVFSVLDQQPGQERSFFLLEDRLLQSFATVYNWSPFDDLDVPPEQQRRLERALFARTGHAARGTSVVPVRLAEGRTLAGGPGNTYWRPAAARAEYEDELSQPHTLWANSFPEKASRVAQLRRQRLEWMSSAWTVAAGVLILLLLAALAYFKPVLCAVLSAVGCGLTIFLVVPLLLLSPMVGMMAPTDGAAAPAFEMSEGAVMLGGSGAAAPKLRENFPETLLWRPELITNDAGLAELEFDLADSITTWRLTTSAVSAQGQLGGARFPIRVFQPFFVDLDLPVALTRHDEVAVPVVVYNYLDEPQEVEIELVRDDWFELLPTAGEEGAAAGAAQEDEQAAVTSKRTLRLQPGEVRSVRFPLRALQVGRHRLEVSARGGEVADAVRREVEVVPNGQRTEQVHSGRLSQPLELQLDVPDDVVPGSATAVVTLHSSSFSQVVEGLDAILRMPHGCFEQTSSTTYPNVLALQYLRSTGLAAPEIEARARQYIHVGYQRLLSFEVPGGGFDWYGRPPADEALTAYGLLEFHDMAQVHDVDPDVVQRTRRWLLDQRAADGSWSGSDRFAAGRTSDEDAALGTTAYVAWSVFSAGPAGPDDQRTLDFLLARDPRSINDPYLVALLLSALAAMDPRHPSLDAYVARLDQLKQVDEQQNQIWWSQGEGGRTMFFGSGPAGDVEATAMATLALLQVNRYADLVRGALHWLVAHQDAAGTWHSTQATVLALKALLQGSGSQLPGDSRSYEVLLDGQTVRSIEVTPDQLGVVQRVELPALAPGSHPLLLRDATGSGSGYHVAFRYYRDVPEVPAEQAPLSISLQYDRQRLAVDERLTATAVVTNNLAEAAPMVMLDLPVPPGFRAEAEEFDELVGAERIARYQITPRQVIVYLRRLDAGASLELRYRLRATMPVKVSVPAAEAYEYYNPARRGRGGSAELEVREA